MQPIQSKYPYAGVFCSMIGGRAENQDYCDAIDTPLGLLVIVCDGMGGGPGGATASYMAVEVIKNTVLGSGKDADHEQVLRVALDNANLALRQKMVETPSLRGMGSTAVVLLIDEESAVIAHLGDSRAYKLKGKDKIFRTADHSYVAEMVRNKTLTEEQARLSAQSNIITKALGCHEVVEPDIDVVAYEKGDRFVLCTDGIWGAMPEPELIKDFSVKKQLAVLVESIAMKVDSLGKSRGNSHDNLTIAIVQTNVDSKLKEKMTKKAKLIILALAVLLVASFAYLCTLYGKASNSDKLQDQIAQLEQTLSERQATIEELNQTIGRKDYEIELANAKAETEKQRAETEKEKARAADIKAEVAQDEAKRAKENEKNKNTSKKDDKPIQNSKYTKTVLKTTPVAEAIDIILAKIDKFKSKNSGRKSKVSLQSSVINDLKMLRDNKLIHKKTAIGKIMAKFQKDEILQYRADNLLPTVGAMKLLNEAENEVKKLK